LDRDVNFAYKTLLRAVEMMSEPYPASNDPAAVDEQVKAEAVEGMSWKEMMRVGGWKTRVWWDLAAVSPLRMHIEQLLMACIVYHRSHAIRLNGWLVGGTAKARCRCQETGRDEIGCATAEQGRLVEMAGGGSGREFIAVASLDRLWWSAVYFVIPSRSRFGNYETLQSVWAEMKQSRREVVSLS
jgi:hypothetical protein